MRPASSAAVSWLAPRRNSVPPRRGSPDNSSPELLSARAAHPSIVEGGEFYTRSGHRARAALETPVTAFDVFIKIGDIKGEAAESKHKGEIEVSSFSRGATNAGPARISWCLRAP